MRVRWCWGVLAGLGLWWTAAAGECPKEVTAAADRIRQAMRAEKTR